METDINTGPPPIETGKTGPYLKKTEKKILAPLQWKRIEIHAPLQWKQIEILAHLQWKR